MSRLRELRLHGAALGRGHFGGENLAYLADAHWGQYFVDYYALTDEYERLSTLIQFWQSQQQ